MIVSLAAFDNAIVFCREPRSVCAVYCMHGNTIEMMIFIIVVIAEYPPVTAKRERRSFPERGFLPCKRPSAEHGDVENCQEQTVVIITISGKIQSEIRRDCNFFLLIFLSYRTLLSIISAF